MVLIGIDRGLNPSRDNDNRQQKKRSELASRLTVCLSTCLSKLLSASYA